MTLLPVSVRRAHVSAACMSNAIQLSLGPKSAHVELIDTKERRFHDERDSGG